MIKIAITAAASSGNVIELRRAGPDRVAIGLGGLSEQLTTSVVREDHR